jgi:hypothetical protein
MDRETRTGLLEPHQRSAQLSKVSDRKFADSATSKGIFSETVAERMDNV